MVGFLKAINDADTDSQIAIFLQILAHCVMGFFFRLYHVRCAFFSTRHHTILVLYQRQKNMKTMYVQCRIHYVVGQANYVVVICTDLPFD